MLLDVIGMYPPVSSNISSLIFPATETSMARPRGFSSRPRLMTLMTPEGSQIDPMEECSEPSVIHCRSIITYCLVGFPYILIMDSDHPQYSGPH